MDAACIKASSRGGCRLGMGNLADRVLNQQRNSKSKGLAVSNISIRCDGMRAYALTAPPNSAIFSMPYVQHTSARAPTTTSCSPCLHQSFSKSTVFSKQDTRNRGVRLTQTTQSTGLSSPVSTVSTAGRTTHFCGSSSLRATARSSRPINQHSTSKGYRDVSVASTSHEALPSGTTRSAFSALTAAVPDEPGLIDKAVLPHEPPAVPQAVGVVIVDHGSRKRDSNDQLMEFGKLYQATTGAEIVEMAHMEIAEPTIAQAIGNCVLRGASRVVIAPYFLSKGRHIQEDIPALVAAAQALHPTVPCVIAEPIGIDPLMALLISNRVKTALKQ